MASKLRDGPAKKPTNFDEKSGIIIENETAPLRTTPGIPHMIAFALPLSLSFTGTQASILSKSHFDCRFELNTRKLGRGIFARVVTSSDEEDEDEDEEEEV